MDHLPVRTLCDVPHYDPVTHGLTRGNGEWGWGAQEMEAHLMQPPAQGGLIKGKGDGEGI